MTSTTGRAATPNISRGVLRPRAPKRQAEHQQIRGTATALGIAPGSTFTLYNAPHADDNREYLTLQANYHLKENRYASGDDQSSEHRIDFIVLPADVPRTRRSRPPPKTHGPQTARVVGPAGESIWTDKYGRIKVKFHWDRFGPKDDGSSCWVRVSSAGPAGLRRRADPARQRRSGGGLYQRRSGSADRHRARL